MVPLFCMGSLDSHGASGPIRILLVDDDPSFSKVVQTILQMYRQRTFITTWKESVESALTEIAQNQEIDVILTDYYFPTSNGLEFCLQLNQISRSIPIIFLTSARDLKLAVEAMKLGVEDFLVKDDIDQTHLPRTIISILDRLYLRKHKQAVEKRLAMAENRAEAIRELVVTVCHEFNNPLAAVKISFDLMQRQIQETIAPEVMRDFESNFDKIDSEIKQLRDLNFEKIEFNAEDTKSGG
jgi:FixJ family two-component response regulator